MLDIVRLKLSSETGRPNGTYSSFWLVVLSFTLVGGEALFLLLPVQQQVRNLDPEIRKV